MISHLPGLGLRTLCGTHGRAFHDPPACLTCQRLREREHIRLARRGLLYLDLDALKASRSMPVPPPVYQPVPRFDREAYLICRRLFGAIAAVARRLQSLTVPYFDGRCEAMNDGKRCRHRAIMDHLLGYAVCGQHARGLPESTGLAKTEQWRRDFFPRAVVFRAGFKAFRIPEPDF